MKTLTPLLVTIALSFSIACDDPVTPEPKIGNGAGSPMECIRLMEIGINNRDLERFRDTLSPQFVFYFDSWNVGDEINGYVIPETWGVAEEERAIWNMIRPYESGGAYDIFIVMLDGDIGTPPEGSETHTAEDVWIYLEILTEENEGFVIDWGYVEFGFEKITEGDSSYWVITEWKDMLTWDPDETLGYIKAYFYALDPLPE